MLYVAKLGSWHFNGQLIADHDEEIAVKGMDGAASLTSFSPSVLIQSHKLNREETATTEDNSP